MKSNFLFLIAIMALGLGLRLLLVNGGVDLDESITDYVSSSPTLDELVNRIVHCEFGPPLYFCIMMLWRKLTPDKAIYLALPSFIFGMLLIPLTYLLAKKITESNKISLVSALFCAMSPLALFYSHEARLYSLFACLNVCAAYFYLDWLKNRKRSSLVALSIFACLITYTHYLAFFFLGLLVMAAFLYCLIQKQTTEFFKAIPLFFLPAALFLPWLKNMKEHLSVGTYWVERTQFDNWWQVIVSNIAALTPAPWVVGAIFSIFALIVFLILWLKKIIVPKAGAIVFLLAILIPPTVLIGYITPFIFGYCRYMMPFAPFAWILLAILLVESTKPKILVALLVVLGICNTMEAKSLGSLNRSGLRQLAHDMKNKKFGESLYLVLPDYDVYTLRYYLRTEGPHNTNFEIISFPNLNVEYPIAHQGYADAWRDYGNIEKLFDYLENAKKTSLVVIRDPAVLESTKMPAKSRIDLVMDKLNAKYQKTGVTEKYNAKGRSYFVERFTLSRDK